MIVENQRASANANKKYAIVHTTHEHNENEHIHIESARRLSHTWLAYAIVRYRLCVADTTRPCRTVQFGSDLYTL